MHVFRKIKHFTQFEFKLKLVYFDSIPIDKKTHAVNLEISKYSTPHNPQRRRKASTEYGLPVQAR